MGTFATALVQASALHPTALAADTAAKPAVKPTAEQRDLCRRVGISFETIPGISAFSAAAAVMLFEAVRQRIAE